MPQTVDYVSMLGRLYAFLKLELRECLQVSKLQHLLDANAAWASAMKERDAEFFSRLADQQHPDYLWIGCSDSRVPASQIINLQPGEVFVHRNIANVVPAEDTNALSVIQYAVEALKVKHIVVCGHYGCGGVRAALLDSVEGTIAHWLENVKAVAQKHQQELDALDESARESRLCELNVLAQVQTVKETSFVQEAWNRQQPLEVHGWIYDIRDGVIHELVDGASGASS